MTPSEAATFIETAVRNRWREYSFQEPIEFLQERLWWFRISVDANESAVFFSIGPNRDEARERLECSLRMLSPQFLTLMEFDSGEVLGNVPLCMIHQTPMFPAETFLFRRLCFWKCGSKGCPGHQVTFKLSGHPRPLPYIAASLGTVMDIGGA